MVSRHNCSSLETADDATDSATLSKSWAVGGTGKRENEDVNNAKYWASIAGAAVLDKGAEIIRLAEEERRKYEDG